MTATSRTTIKPTHKPLKTYYATLQNLSTLFVSHENTQTAVLPLSILTSFKEFALYDCRVTPRYPKRACIARCLRAPSRQQTMMLQYALCHTTDL